MKEGDDGAYVQIHVQLPRGLYEKLVSALIKLGYAKRRSANLTEWIREEARSCVRRAEGLA